MDSISQGNDVVPVRRLFVQGPLEPGKPNREMTVYLMSDGSFVVHGKFEVEQMFEISELGAQTMADMIAALRAGAGIPCLPGLVNALRSKLHKE